MRNPFAPVSRSLALEQRILFDAAAVAAVDQQQNDQIDGDHAHQEQSQVDTSSRQILAVDSRINGAQSLAASIKPNTIVVLVDATQDGMAAISAALQQAGKVDSIQILGHGNEGQMRLGSSILSASSADTGRASEWSANLTDSADILIYGCRTGAGEAGTQLIDKLAVLTGADVAASTDDTGNSSAGGDWVLERQFGVIESALAINAEALTSYSGLMADASPTVTLSTSALKTVLGDQLTFTATFTNPTSQAGYAPFIDLILPATGKDGVGTEIDDGITFVSATYLGQTVKSYIITFDANGNATHPLAKDSSGQAIIINAATYGAQAGDQLVVLELPYASVLQSQPAIDIQITCQLSNLADTTGSPALTIKARGGFQFGNDPADNPFSDPSLFEANFDNVVVTPTSLKLTQTINMPEGETVTGPNFDRTVTVTTTPPPGQTLTNVEITQTVPDNLRYRSITPAAGGELISITLANGDVITDSGLLAQVFAVGPYLSGYTVRFATLNAPADTVITFYVPEKSATGVDILDPVTGNDRGFTFSAPTATAEWIPLDPRDVTVIDPGPPAVTEPTTVTATGNDASFTAKSVALYKTVTIASNTGSTGLSPGDQLQYTLNVDLSDYFAIGKTLFGAGNLTIADQLGDGQSLTGSPVLTIFFEGTQYNIALVTSSSVDGNGVTTLTFDIAQSIADSNAIFGGALIGDIAFDGELEGATRAIITYRSTVNEAYTPNAYPQKEINEGDSIGNNATISGTLLSPNLLVTGDTESDTSAASLSVPTNTVATSIVSVNGSTPPSNGELKPDDVVTFKLAYNLTTGDYEDFKLTAYLPLPLFDLTGISWTQGSGSGQWDYGSGDTNADNVDSVTLGAGNSLIFDFADHATPSSAGGTRIEVQFTLTVGNQPFGDNRSLTVLGQSDQLTTIPTQQHLVSSGVVNIASIAEPVLAIQHGVVAVGSASGGIISSTTGTWAAAGTTGQAPFTGSITDLTAIDGNVSGIDGGDLVRLATAIENSGGLGAFDVTTTVTLPTGFAFVGGNLAAANLAIYRGDGTALVLNTDYSVSGNTITFLDHNGQATLQSGRAGTANDTSGANLVVITYDVLAANNIDASKNLQTTATLTNYSSADGGPDFTPGIDPQDTADQTIAAPTVALVFADGTLSNDDSSATHTSGSDLVVGESMLYDIVVTLPEGTTQNLRITDLIPAGMRLDTGFGSGGYELITTTAASGALTSNFAGTVNLNAPSPTGNDGDDLNLTFSASTATADNTAGNNSFVIRVRLIASNVTGNQAGVARPNSAQAIYSDTDSDTPNGSTAIDRTVAISGIEPSITVREPTLTVTQTQTNDGGPLGVDRNDIITYTITISNGTSASDFDAFDIAFSDIAPSQLSFQSSGYTVTYAGGATNNGGADFVLNTIANTLLTAANANIDIPKGGSITITVEGKVKSDVGSITDIVNTAEVKWTSLNDSNNTASTGERSGDDGLLNSGALNDYWNSNALTVPVAAGATISHVGLLPDTPLPTPDTSRPETAAVGELIYYRAAFLIPEGNTNAASVVINLPTGLSFAGDTRVAIVDGGTSLVSSDAILSTNPGAVRIDQDITDLEQSLLTTDLSNAATAALNPLLINTTNPNAITISLGNVSNTNNDAFFQMIYLDFFVRVDNLGSVDTTDNFNVSADFFSGALLQTSTPVAVEQIVEPNLRDLQKTVTDFNPNTAGSTGTATVTLAFSNSGDGIAYDAHLTDSVTGGSNYVLSTVIINGTSYTPGNLPAGVTVSTSGGITADFSTVAIGSTINLVYTVDVPNGAAIASTNATLDWSSLPESFTDGSAVAGGNSVTVGADGTGSGERDGSDGASLPNNYVVSEGAGLGIISGTLWDDTSNPNDGLTLGGTRLANQIVTLTWAGIDGNLATTGDNRTFTAITDSNGEYHFAVLPTGNFRIDAANPVTGYPFGGDTDNANVRIDSDAGTLGSVTVTALGDGATGSALFGYVRDNDAPVNTLPASPTTLEDTPLNITGIFISDIDAGSEDLTVTLSVNHGTLNLSSLTDVTVTAGALNSATVTISGAFDKLNTALQSLIYTPTLNYNGTDTLTITTNDLGHSGDTNGNLMPNELADARTDTDTLTINITPVNDDPAANDDVMIAIEKGGVDNTVGGLIGAVAVIKNDTDVDIATNGDSLRVTKIGFGTGAPTTTVGLGAFTPLAGTYGELFIQSSGNARYVINNDHPDVQALRLSGNTLTEVFTYEIMDQSNRPATATITVTIQGANDTPIGVNDEGQVYEAGGVNNGTPGAASVLPNVLTGNPLAGFAGKDTDVDLYGETKNVTGIRAKRENAPLGAFSGVASATDALSGTSVAGAYGTLKIGADGSYTYLVDDNATAVDNLAAGDTLFDYFSYIVTDALGDTDIAEIRITINGTNDNPVASNDVALAQAASTNGNAQEVNPAGNVILFQSRPGAITPAPGNGIDSDVDRTDQPNSNLRVNGIRAGAEGLGDTTTNVSAATNLIGSFGTLTINPDGSFSYNVDSTNSTLQALAPGQTVTETFTYRVVDTGGLTDLAELNIIVSGVNDPPVANDVFVTAIEAGGIANGTAGTNPSGDAMANDFDPDGDPIALVGVRSGDDASGETGLLAVAPGSTSTTNGTIIVGSYGTLTIGANGTFSYVVNNNNPAVEALRTSANTLSETFTYQIADNATTVEKDLGQIIVTIEGRNDNPMGDNDTAIAVEAGGLNNAIAGTNRTGNVLSNDDDVDAGDSKTVTAIRTGAEAATGTAGTVGVALIGTYGTLTLNDDGSYQYVVDNNNAAVQALRTTSNTLSETFTYTFADTAGATDKAQLTITIQGANDSPVAINDSAFGWPPIFGSPNSGRNPTGNVLNNDSDIDSGDGKSVTTIRSGIETSGGSLTPVTPGSSSGSGAERINGTYGWLNIGADGSYLYEVDFARTSGLAPGDIVVDYFTYELQDTGGLTDLAQLSITIRGKNNPPIAVPNLPLATEAGGIGNGTPGIDPTGDVTANDFDFEGDALSVDAIRTGAESGSGINGTIGNALAGTYGWLTQQADGTFTYRVDNDNTSVESLRINGNILQDFFTYTVSDIYGVSDQATITVTIRGANDNPRANDDSSEAVESGGIANTTAGSNATGNVLDNDTDKDAYGETKTVIGIRSGAETGSGNNGSVGTIIAGLYGSLTLNSDGSYTYVIDNNNPNVEALRTSSETLTDVFTYQVGDALGATDNAQLNIIIRGANDNPVAQNDSGLATDASGPAITTGNVLPNDGDIDNSETQTVVAIRTGAETASGTSGQVGQLLQGLYGSLLINADGSYTYTVDLNNPDVQKSQGLGPILQDVFTYTIADRSGATDQAELVITIDIAAPYVELKSNNGGSVYQRDNDRDFIYALNIDPVTFVTEAVREIDLLLNLSSTRTSGEKIRLVLPPEISLVSQAAGLGINSDKIYRPILLQSSSQGAVNTDRNIEQSPSLSTKNNAETNSQLLRPTLRFLDTLNRFEQSKVTGREGIVSLSADNMLPNISVFTADLPSADKEASRSKSAASFTEQLKKMSDRPTKSLPDMQPNN